MYPCIGNCGRQVATPGTRCAFCSFGPRAVVRPVVQAPPPIVIVPLAPVLNHVVQNVPPPPPIFNPNTLPPGANLQVTAARSGNLVFSVLDPANLVYVLQGTTIDFRASQTGASVQDAPRINFATTAWGGTAGAAGAANAKSVRFDVLSVSNNALGAYTVILTFGGQTVTIQCVVYSLTTTKVIADNFAGRSTTDFGVDERMTLGFTTQPVGVTALQIGGLRWSVADARREKDGLLHNPLTHATPVLPNGTAEYIAPCTTNDGAFFAHKTRIVQLRLRVDSGICVGLGKEFNITVWTPTAHMRKVVGSERHTQGVASAGFLGEIFFSPLDVSFRTLSFQEGAGAIRTRGFGNDIEDGVTQHVPSGVNIPITGGNSVTGCQLGGGMQDNVDSGDVAHVPLRLPLTLPRSVRRLGQFTGSTPILTLSPASGRIHGSEHRLHTTSPLCIKPAG